MLVAMAQDIRYPGVRVGEACGPWTACLAGVEGRKSYAYHYHYHTITITNGIKPLCLGHGHGHGHGQRHGLGLGHGTSKSPKAKAQAKAKANGHKLVAMAQDIRYPGVRVGEACGTQIGL